MAFVQRDDLATISQQGPATPDHVIRTKRLAQLGRDVSAFADSYERYFQEHASNSLQMLDRAPRVNLDPQIGVATLGRTAQDAAIAFEVYQHSIDIFSRFFFKDAATAEMYTLSLHDARPTTGSMWPT